MTLVVISDAYPIDDGSPRQREAADLRRQLERHDAVAWITIDAYDRQGADWARLDSGVWALPFGRGPSGRIDPAALMRDPLSLPTVQKDAGLWPRVSSAGSLHRGWLTTRRLERITARIARIGPDAVLLDGVILSRLAEGVRPYCRQVVLRSRGELATLEAFGGPAADAARQIWRQLVTSRMRADIAAAAGFIDTVWAGDNDGPGPVVTGAHAVAMGPLPAPPLPWTATYDRTILVCEREARASSDLSSALDDLGLDTVTLALVGHSASLRRVMMTSDWPDMTSALALSRAVYLPSPDVFTIDAVGLALASGVPVVCPTWTRDLLGHSAHDGVITADTPEQAARALSRLLQDDLHALSPDIVVRASARRQVALDRFDAAVARLSDPSKPRDPCAPVTRRPRLSPHVGVPEVYYTPASRMLMARARIRNAALVTEIEIADTDGVALTTFYPKQDPARRGDRIVEGGGIVDADRLRQGAVLIFRAGQVELGRLKIDPADLIRVQCELVVLERESTTRARGVFWIEDAALEPHTRLMIDVAGVASDMIERRRWAVEGLDITAVEFSLPIDHATSPGRTLQLAVPDVAGPRLLNQRPFVITPMVARAPRAPGGAIGRLKDLHRGQRCWILGNGPSVRPEDLDRIPAGDIVIAFNRFYLAHPSTTLREDYLFSSDTLMIRDFGQEMIDRSRGQVVLSQSDRDSQMFNDLSGEMLTVTPSDNGHQLFSYAVHDFISPAGSSVIAAIQVAFYMGLRDIYLYGIDYSFTLKPVHDPRYRFPVSFNEGNHFIPGYRADQPWCPPTWRDISAGFLMARIGVEAGGGRIRNATRGGRLETFPRIAFDAAVREAVASRTSVDA